MILINAAMTQVGAISANGDADMGAMVADAIEKVGQEGAVTVEEAKGTETALEIVEGLQFDRGYLSPYFIAEVEGMRAELEEPLILLHARALGDVTPANDDQRMGVDILRRALTAPTFEIASNAGVNGALIVGRLLECTDSNHGFDAQNGVYGDLFAAGVIDPTKVARLALQNAASVAGLLITTQVVVHDKPKPAGRGRGGGPEDLEGLEADF
ncbi:TCP-1/cpn60 chaperonin family protein [Phenylobacterium sp.]|uniref:TCP-1/cpn60 chaperonin family protein n=1 Tax=Phenylobacterium sp. TaxID=1871053 RepID=UPI0025CBF431|nr:TCP-1/cpn60 chaperonin family protein [Phenylobacterium sp.]